MSFLWLWASIGGAVGSDLETWQDRLDWWDRTCLWTLYQQRPSAIHLIRPGLRVSQAGKLAVKGLAIPCHVEVRKYAMVDMV